jgi:hypothetical protein
MESITVLALQEFLQRLGAGCTEPAEFYLLGGSALCMLGSPRETLDIDYTCQLPPEQALSFQALLDRLGAELELDLESVPLGEFIPLAPEALQRRRLVGRYGKLDVYIFDLYSIAISKIARGFEADIEDVLFMLEKNLIVFSELERFYQIALPQAASFDIDPKEFRAYFAEIRRRWVK